MQIRSITYFFHPGFPINELSLQKAGIFIRHAKHAYESAGYPVQTLRMATPPFYEYLMPEDYPSFITKMEILGHSEGFEYVSLGPAAPDQLGTYNAIPEMLANSENLFFSGHLTKPNGEISLAAVRRCAEVIHAAAPLEANGFANLRFAALANVRPWAPFFPAAYHQGKTPAFALALEAADLAVNAFNDASSLQDARTRLIKSIEDHAQKLETQSAQLRTIYKIEFKGLDFSLAPFPSDSISIGKALESLGISALGLSGSLAAAAFLTDTIDRAEFKRTGFNGLMLPLLEDSILAKRGGEGVLGVKDLLLYSAVCGTGLDTIPIPGDVEVGQIQAVLLDLASLSSRLAKPLTARLMPIPGKKAGDPTGFNFEFFANSKVLSLPAQPMSRFMTGEETFALAPRQRFHD